MQDASSSYMACKTHPLILKTCILSHPKLTTQLDSLDSSTKEASYRNHSSRITSHICIIDFPNGTNSWSTSNIKQCDLKLVQRERRILKANCWYYSICGFCEESKKKKKIPIFIMI